MCRILVIILPPVINVFPGINDSAEPVIIQKFIVKGNVKALQVCSALVSPAGLSASQHQAQKPIVRVRGRKTSGADQFL